MAKSKLLGIAKRSTAIIANISLLLNSFIPFLLVTQPIYAQEAPTPIEEVQQFEPTPIPEITQAPEPEPTIIPTPEITPELTPTIEPTPTIIPTPILDLTPTDTPVNMEIGANPPSEPTISPTPENTPILETTPTVTPTITPIEAISEKVCLTNEQIKDTNNEEWNIDDNTGVSETKGKVQLGVRYVYPQESKVSVTFKCLPKDENLRTSLKIQKIKTSDLKLPDTIDSINEFAYDITTGMKDGDFEYDITLPKPENSTAEISYIEKTVEEAKTNLTFFDVNKIEESKTEQSNNEIKATNVDHFTIFIVTNGGDSSDTSFQQFVSSDLDKIKISDNNRLESDGRWNNSNYSSDRYIEFTFNPELSTTSTITSPVKLIFEYQRDALAVDSYYNDYKARLQILNQTTNIWELLSDNVRIEDPTVDKTFNITIPTKYVDSIDKTNNLKIRFQTVGRKFLSTSGIKTYHDYAALDFSFEDSHKMNICHNTASPTNPWNAINIDSSAWPTHQTLHHDFLYNGPLKPNGHPDNSGGRSDIWCNNNVPSYCDDGIVNPNLGEQCDLGSLNGQVCVPAYNGTCNYCNDSCKTVTVIGPKCGDEIKNGEEQCDGTDGVTSGYTCSETCELIRNIGTINIDKITNPSSDTTSFNFNIKSVENEIDENISLKDQDTPFTKVYSTGIYTIEEKTLPTGWKLTDLDCDQTVTVDLKTNKATFDLDRNENITCTFTNTRSTSSLVINKIIDEDGNLETTNDQTLGINWEFDVNGSSFDSSNPNNQFTDIGGSSIFSNIKTGVYSINEIQQDGYDLINVNCGLENGSLDGDTVYNVNVSEDSNTVCTFYNTPNGTIHGYKWSDIDGSGGPISGQGEKLLSGWTIKLYKGNDGTFGSEPIKTMVTDDSDQHFGWYWFEHLFPGQYKVCETPQLGWKQIYPANTNNNCHIVNLPDDNSNGFPEMLNAVAGPEYNFGNQQLSNVNVTKFNDIDGDGTKGENEAVLGAWTINLTDQESQITNENGQVNFNNLTPGTYGLSEDLKPGWNQTAIYCESQPTDGVLITSPGEAYGHHGACSGWNGCGDAATCAQWACEVKGYDQLVSYGDQRPCTQFGNCNLFNSRGSVQMNWGNWCPVMGVTDIRCSSKTKLSPTPTSNPEIGLNNLFKVKQVIAQEAPNGYQVNVGSGQNLKCYIGNQLITPTANISKSNNAGGTSLVAGASVEYKMNLDISGNDVTNFKVTDLLSDGFKYRLGSYKVYRNGVDVTAMVPEPPYHSPGVWDLTALGKLTPEDEFELIYTADIAVDQQSGIYKDLAYASGKAAYEEKNIIAMATPIGKVDDNFVGTQVSVIEKSRDSVVASVGKTETKTGSVLGASTEELPGTGASTLWLIFSGLLAIIGLMFIKFNKKLLIIVFLTFLSFGFINSVNAEEISNLVVRVEEPRSPTNTKDVQLKFVALDIQNRPVVIKCLKKSPTDSSFIQFSTETLTAGGNASNCSLISVLNSQGLYQFKIEASADGESIDSQIINLEYKTTTPGTPNDYSKEKEGSCRYKINFKASNDGITNIIRIYRADITNFIADSGSQVGQVGISPDQKGSFTDVSVPDCNKEYYYVIRAFDEAGNGSDLVGDSVVKTIINTTTTTNTTNTTGSVSGPLVVVGENNVPSEITPTTEVTPSTEASQGGEVLGARTDFAADFKSFISRHKISTAMAAVLILVIMGYGFKKFQKRKQY